MKRLVFALLFLTIAASCSSKKADEAAVAEEKAPAASAAPAPAPAQTAEPAKVEFTDALVQESMEYQKQKLAIVSKFAEETRKNLAAAKGDAANAAQIRSTRDSTAGDGRRARCQAGRRVGLSKERFDALEGAIELVANGHLLYNRMGGDAQLAKMEAESKQGRNSGDAQGPRAAAGEHSPTCHRASEN